VPVIEVQAHINDQEFAQVAVQLLLDLLVKNKAQQQQFEPTANHNS
jgi:hypothetical protein